MTVKREIIVTDKVRAFALTGMLGAGYLESSLKRAMSWNPDFIGCDAGSTDGGPASLGSGKCSFSRHAVKRDLRLALLAVRSEKIPLLIGSAGSAGGDLNLAWVVDIVKEIAQEEDLHFKMAIIMLLPFLEITITGMVSFLIRCLTWRLEIDTSRSCLKE